MRRTKPLAALAVASLLALAACGSGDGPSEGASGEFGETDAGKDKDPEAEGPAPEIEGAEAGGTITVFLPGDPGPDDLDPTNGWSVTGNSIQQALTSRSLTQYRVDEDGNATLVPDLAVDLGTPNEDFTQWTFQLRDDATWEDGSPITAEEVAFGIARSMDSTAFPGGPGTEYSTQYFAGGDEFEGPYTDKDTDWSEWEGVDFDNDANTVTINMAKPFPDMDYWGAFMAMGPAPLGKASQPPAYGQNIMSNGPYKVESFRAQDELVLVKNDQWDPESDPARHQYADKFVFKFNADPDQTDQIMLSDNTESQTAISTDLSASSYQDALDTLGDRLVQQSVQCTGFLYPNYETTDLAFRKAIAYGYPYEDVWAATGQVPGVTRVQANSIMPPGMAGKPEYFVDGEAFTYDPEKAKELLAESETDPLFSAIYYEPDPLAVAGAKVAQKGLEEAGFEVKYTPVQDSPYSTWTNPDDKLNKSLSVRGVNWCSDWPSGSTFIPALFRGGATYNTGNFDEPAINEAIEGVAELPIEEQADAWGDIDEQIMTEYFPVIPTNYYNNLFTFGTKIGNPSGDEALGAPNYKNVFVMP